MLLNSSIHNKKQIIKVFKILEASNKDIFAAGNYLIKCFYVSQNTKKSFI